MDSFHTGGEYGLLFASNPMPMWVFDIETLQFLEVNEAAVAKYQFSRDEFLGMTIADIRPSEDVHELNAYLKAPAAALRPHGLWRHRRKDGTQLTVEITAQDVVFKQRRARLVVAQDVGEHHQFAVELQKRQQFLQSVLDAMPAVVFVKDREGRFTLVNTAWEQFTGVSRDKATGKTARDVFPADVADRFRRDDVATFDANARTEIEEVIPSAQGQQALLTSRFPLRDEEGRIEGLVGLAVDITDRKQAEDSLQRANAFAETVVQTANVIFLHLDAAGIVRKINAAAEEGHRIRERRGGRGVLVLAGPARPLSVRLGTVRPAHARRSHGR